MSILAIHGVNDKLAKQMQVKYVVQDYSST